MSAPIRFFVENTYYYRWEHTPRSRRVVVVLYGGAMLDGRCPGIYNVLTEAYDVKPDNEKAWVSELFDYGLDVVVLSTGSADPTFECYAAGSTWVSDLINYLQELYGEICFFGHSAGGAITAYEIQQRTTITAAVVVSAPTHDYHDPLFDTPTNARNVKANVLLQWGQQDLSDHTWTQGMPEYYQNAQGCGHIVQKDDTYTDDLHDTYFTAPAQTQRNKAKAFLMNTQTQVSQRRTISRRKRRRTKRKRN
ncbi:MAG: hypothetical protein ABSA92_04980 [Candidatus Bathyarchaeia archaeon]